jgi:hypothetical protein
MKYEDADKESPQPTTDTARSAADVVRDRDVLDERRYRADQERRLADLAPRIRKIVADHANQIGRWRMDHSACCGAEWQAFATWVDEVPGDDLRLVLLASFPGPDWGVLLEDYFDATVGSDSFGFTAVNEWCYRARWEPVPAAYERLLDLLLLDATATALAYPW